MRLCGRLWQRAAAGQHPQQRAVFVQNMVLQGPRHMGKDRRTQQEHGVEMDGAEQLRHQFGFGHHRQVLPKRPPDRSKAIGGCVMYPARERHNHHRTIEDPMRSLRSPGFQFAIGMQKSRLFLRDCPQDAQKRGEKHRNTKSFVKRKQKRGARDHRLRAIKAAALDLLCQLSGKIAQRKGAQDQERGQPMKGLGDGAVALICVLARHGGTVLDIRSGGFSPR